MALRLAGVPMFTIELRTGFKSIKSAVREKRVRSKETYSVALHTFLKDD